MNFKKFSLIALIVILTVSMVVLPLFAEGRGVDKGKGKAEDKKPVGIVEGELYLPTFTPAPESAGNPIRVGKGSGGD